MWASYLTRTCQQYGCKAMAGLILHDFALQSGEVLESCNNVPKRYRWAYAKLAKNHPWAQYMWRDPAGTMIFPDERRVIDRVSQNRNIDAFVRALIKRNIPIGIGAVLWKDNHPNPRFVVAIAILRPGNPYNGDTFSRNEKDVFACEIPPLVNEIKNHERVRKIAI